MAQQRMAQAAWELVEPFWYAVSIYDGPDVFCRQFSEIPQHCGHLFAVHWLTSEVCNGGFHQFFFNDTGVLAPEAVAGLKLVGLHNVAAVVEEAIARLGPDYPRDREERIDRLDSLDPDDVDEADWESPFDELDDRFYDLIGMNHECLETACDRYAAQFPVPAGLPMWRRRLVRFLLRFK